MNLQEVFEENLKFLTRSTLDPDIIKKQFVQTENYFMQTVGYVDLPSGQIAVGDPFEYLYQKDLCPLMILRVRPGIYPVQLSFSKSSVAGIRICTARIKFNQMEDAVYYEIAGEYFEGSDAYVTGFPASSGMMAFISAEGATDYRRFALNWYRANPDTSLKDGYFVDVLEESVEKFPQYKKMKGDFAEWTVPYNAHKMFITTTGFGRGFYNAFWGFDANGEICELTVPMIDTELIDHAEADYMKVWDGAELCLATRRIAEEGCNVGYMYREEPDTSFPDSGWRFLEGNEDSEYLDDPDNSTMISIHEIASNNPLVIPLLHSPCGTAFFKNIYGEFAEDMADMDW